MFVPIADQEIPATVALINRAYRSAESPSGWSIEASYLSGDRTTEALLRADLTANPGASILKWEDADTGQLRACVWLQPLLDSVWFLGTLAIDPEQQNSGLGRTVLSAAEDWVRRRGGTRIRMTVVNVRDALIAWYLRRGYRRTGETRPFPYGDNRFGTPLRNDLSFVVLEKSLVTAESKP